MANQIFVNNTGVDVLGLEWTIDDPVNMLSCSIVGKILKSAIPTPDYPWVLDASVPEEILLFENQYAATRSFNGNVTFSAPAIMIRNIENNTTTPLTLVSGFCDIMIYLVANYYDESSEVLATTSKRTRVPAPSNLAIYSKTISDASGLLALTWNEGSYNTYYYEHVIELYRENEPPVWVIAEETNYGDILIDLDTEYNVRVYMRVKGSEESASLPSNSILALISSPCPKPVVVQTAATATTATISLEPCSNLKNYNVYVDTNPATYHQWQAWDVNTDFISSSVAILTLATSEQYPDYLLYDGVQAYNTGLTYITAASYSLKIRIDAVNLDGNITTGDPVTIQLAPAKLLDLINIQSYVDKFVLMTPSTPFNGANVTSQSLVISGKNLKTQESFTTVLPFSGAYQYLNVYVDTPSNSSGEIFELDVKRRIPEIPFDSEPLRVYAHTSPKEAESVLVALNTIAWQPVPGATFYNVHFFDQNNQELVNFQKTEKHPFTNVDLEPNTVYKVAIRPRAEAIRFYSMTNSETLGWYRTEFTTRFIEVNYHSMESSVTLIWQAIPNATGYQVLYKTNYQGDFNDDYSGAGLTLDPQLLMLADSPINLDASVLSLTLYNLLHGQCYWFAVRALGTNLPLIKGKENITSTPFLDAYLPTIDSKKIVLQFNPDNSLQVSWAAESPIID